jgi:hypothetical protein
MKGKPGQQLAAVQIRSAVPYLPLSPQISGIGLVFSSHFAAKMRLRGCGCVLL